MLQFASIPSQFHVLINELNRCLQEKDLTGFKKCVNEIEEKYESLQNFGDLIDSELELKKKNGFIQGLLNDVARYSSLEIFNYLTIEKNIHVEDIQSVVTNVIVGSQFEFMKYFLTTNNVNGIRLGTIIQAYIMYITLKDKLGFKEAEKELENTFINAIKESTSEEIFENIIKTINDKDMTSVITREYEDSQKLIVKQSYVLNEFATQLSAQVNDSTNPLIKEAIQQILNASYSFYEQCSKNKDTMHLLEINLDLAVINFKKYIASNQSLREEISSEMISIIDEIPKSIDEKFQREKERLEMINEMLSDAFYLLSDSIVKKDLKSFTAALSKLEEKGLSIETLDKMRAKVAERAHGEFVEQILADATASDEIYDYLTKENKLQISDPSRLESIFLKAVARNKIEIAKSLLTSNRITLSLLEVGYNYALLHEDTIIENLILEKINEIDPKAFQDFNRLREEMKQYAVHQYAKVLESVELMMDVNSNILEKCIKYIKKDEVDDSSMHDIFDCTQKLDSIIQEIQKYIKENHVMLETALTIAELLAIKLNLLVKKHEKLKNNSKLKRLTKLLITQMNFDPMDEPILHANIDELPEELRSKIYRDMGEDAIDKPTSGEYGLYHEIKRQYQAKFDETRVLKIEEANDIIKEKEDDDVEIDINDSNYEENETEVDESVYNGEGKGPINLASFQCYPILQDLESYLMSEFKKAGLDKEFNSNWSQAELEPYYKNKFHTAWRYLFCRPNPWLSLTAESNIKWAKHGASDINDDDIELIAYFWLAASDESTKCTNGFTLSLRKEHFVDQLAWFGREYNNGNKRDDLEGDKPTCNIGVKKRGYQLLIGHPILDEVKELTPEAFMGYFQQNLIAENGSHPTLFKRLNELAENPDTQQTVIQLKDALESWIMDCGVVDECKQGLLTKYFSIDMGNELREASTQFFNSVIDDFGKERLNNTKVSYQAETFKSYGDFLVAIAQNPVKYFIQALYKKANSLVESIEKKSKERQDEKAGRPIVNAFENHKKQEQQPQPEEAMELERKDKEKVREEDIVVEEGDKVKKVSVRGRR